jgi:hypothetical protein
MLNKFILDACCGGRMFRFNKKHPNALYVDVRKAEKWFIEARPEFEIQPDEIMSFCDLQYPDKSFKLVVMDPPHFKSLWENSWMAKKYGVLSWGRQAEIQKWFEECWRVLDDYGTLIFKWNESEVKLTEVLQLFDQEPLFWHTSWRLNKTIRLCFMKMPSRIRRHKF